VKSSIAVVAVDPAAQALQYLHGRGLFTVTGEDYRGVLRLDPLPVEALPPYMELVRLNAGDRLADDELRAAARDLLRGHLSRAPGAAAVRRFEQHLQAHLPVLLEGSEQDFHAYAFASVRMLGAAAGVLQLQADWLFGTDVGACERVIGQCKALGFRLARRRAFDPAPLLEQLAADWEQALDELDALVG
jgi:hypothetical protein